MCVACPLLARSADGGGSPDAEPGDASAEADATGADAVTPPDMIAADLGADAGAQPDDAALDAARPASDAVVRLDGEIPSIESYAPAREPRVSCDSFEAAVPPALWLCLLALPLGLRRRRR